MKLNQPRPPILPESGTTNFPAFLDDIHLVLATPASHVIPNSAAERRASADFGLRRNSCPARGVPRVRNTLEAIVRARIQSVARRSPFLVLYQVLPPLSVLRLLTWSRSRRRCECNRDIRNTPAATCMMNIE